MKIILVSFLLLLSFVLNATTDPLIGTYQTIDDKTNKPKSIIKIYQKNNKFFGKIIKIYPKKGEDKDPICDKCTGRFKNKKIIGMTILENLVKKENEYVDGTIMDPDNGKTYDCKLWLEDGKLKVRGYIAFLYRTQTWIKKESK
jgi:uncharacterized protein (DUF2147 family)